VLEYRSDSVKRCSLGADACVTATRSVQTSAWQRPALFRNPVTPCSVPYKRRSWPPNTADTSYGFLVRFWHLHALWTVVSAKPRQPVVPPLVRRHHNWPIFKSCSAFAHVKLYSITCMVIGGRGGVDDKFEEPEQLTAACDHVPACKAKTSHTLSRS
jgi:hypothetical protein